MNNHQIERLLHLVARGKACVIVCSKDQVNDISFSDDVTICAVCTVNQNESVGHWIAFLVIKNKNDYYTELFDSFGEKLSFYNISFPLKINKQSTRAAQGDQSDLCGSYVLFFAYSRLRGYNFESIEKSFSIDREKNDKKMTRFTTFLFKSILPSRPLTLKKPTQRAGCMCDILKSRQ